MVEVNEHAGRAGLKGLFELLLAIPAYRRLTEDIRGGQVALQVEVLEAARPYIISALWHHLGVPIVVIVPRPEDARRLHGQLLSYLGEQEPVYHFPEPEVLPYERLEADVATSNQRMLALEALLSAQAPTSTQGAAAASRPPVVVASTAATLRKTLPEGTFRTARHKLGVDNRVSLAELFSRWVALGYHREEGVEVPGTFSSRGGIVDVFPPSLSLPVRLELLGDEIESIRLFDPVTQRSVRTVEEVSIIPAREILPLLADRDRVSQLIQRMNFSRCIPSVAGRIQEELAGLFALEAAEELPFYSGLLIEGCLIDYLPHGSLLLLVRDGEIESEAWELNQWGERLRAARVERGELPSNFPSPMFSWEYLRSVLESRPRVLMRVWQGAEGGFDFKPASSYHGDPRRFARDLRRMLDEGSTAVVVSRHARRLSEVLTEEGTSATVRSYLESPPVAGSLDLLTGYLQEGWALPLQGAMLTLFTDSEIFGTAKERRPKPKTPIRRRAYLSELLPGEYVVHVDHGVAQFAATVQLESNGEQKEYLLLEYAENDKLYVPTDHLDRVSPYLAPRDQPPSLTRLGTAEWARVKERVKSSTREMARELLELYASRQVVEGHPFSSDSPWQQELEEAFPYEETDDQTRTLQEIKQDMERTRPMDRLVCGDVGYGKTEVALRAAFKAVNDTMQVALLVPTTLLAQQHYATFAERLAPFPVRVEVLSRFRTRKEQGEIIQGLKLGTVDIVIGTHRLVQRDVDFKRLGLIIVDEEQHFGVGHKERLKKMRQQVEVLTLSATPIPRTLYMGLSGIRDMSTMETPPEERLPVKTFVSEYSDEVVKEAILRELERGGQVFFLHNRVQTIRRVADDLKRLIPKARIAIGHGRMAEADLEEAMVDFIRGEVDVLVCTTIIQSGLDIPNANTLIIDRADRFGLSQLYQLRGRVGRAAQRAYTYLLIPRGRRITEAAGKRLKAILEASELGAGFRVAMRDLEIRGTGNILGPEQSGHVHAVGFELYSQLLNEAVAEIKGDKDHIRPVDGRARDIRVNLPLSARIPESYISHLPTRLSIYQRLTRVQGRDEVEDIGQELRDRFGPLPQDVTNLLYLVDLKLLARDSGVGSIAMRGSNITLTLLEAAGGARLLLERALGSQAKVGNQQIHLRVRGNSDLWRGELIGALEHLLAFKDQLESAALPG